MKTGYLRLILAIVLSGMLLLSLSCSGQSSTISTSSATSKSTTTVSTQVSSSSSSTNTSTVNSTSSSQATYSAATAASSPKIMSWSTPPSMQIDTGKLYIATLNTSLGSFKIQLFTQEAPKTVNNFVFLSRQGYFDGVIFHRIMKTFMIQTGDPTGTGRGSPGYKFADELPVKYSYDPGIVAMANSGSNTNGSQFFICTGADAARSLNANPKYTQFGRVIEGMDIVQKIASVQVKANERGEMSKPVNPPVINSILISESAS
jgi:cyclophilin family peptidyl-prolyl cis-trans isomerase